MTGLRALLLFSFVCAAFGADARGCAWQRLGPAVDDFDIHFRVEGRRGSHFNIDIAEGDTLSFKRYTVAVPDVWPDDVASRMDVNVEFSTVADGVEATDSLKKAIISVSRAKTVDISMKITGAPDRALFEVGDRHVTFSAPISFTNTAPLYVRLCPEGNKVLREDIGFTPKAEIRHADFSSVDELLDYLKQSSDPNECVWMFYDRTTSPLRVSSKGSYRLASVKNGSDYDLVYLDDTDGEGGAWQPLMIKARLIGCDIPGVFDVSWTDRDMCLLPIRVTAVIDGDFLTVNFPYYNVSLRFNRLNLENRNNYTE